MYRIPDKENPNVSLSKYCISLYITSRYNCTNLWVCILQIFAESSHIRILAFSPDGIANCSVSINYQAAMQCVKAADNLYVVKWDPNEYKSGSHFISVRIIDGLGRDAEVTFCPYLDSKAAVSQ